MAKGRPGTLQDPASLRELVQRLHEGIYVSRPNGEIVDANPAFLRMVGVESLKELRTLKATDLLVEPEMRKREIELIDRDGSVRDFELQIRRRDGQVRTVIDSSFAITDPATGATLYQGVLVDITDRKRLEQQLLEQSIRDPLTGCYNRRYLSDFEQTMKDRSWGCVVLDIDHFKDYNDRFGHKVGDEVLTRVARFLTRHTRAEEGVVRLGGDEFVVLLAHDSNGTRHAAMRLHQQGARELPVSFSLGWAAREEKEPLEHTMNRADHNLLAVRALQGTAPERRRG